MPAQLVNEILQSMNREVINQLDLTVAISHPGENGRAREQIISSYLRRIVPKEFGIDTGFVVDALGSISKQIDVVIYRTGYHPVFEIGGIKHFMVESVVAVIENRASIGSRDKLQSALENIKSVKTLDRTNEGTNYLISGGQKGLFVNPNEFQHQVFGAIVTEKSMGQEFLKSTLFEFFQANDRRCWPNMYADVRGTCARFLEGDSAPTVTTAIPNEAEYLCLTDPAAENYLPPLLDLTFELINFLRVAPVVDYKPTSYLGSNIGQNSWWKL
jgi:hypothetical protein